MEACLCKQRNLSWLLCWPYRTRVLEIYGHQSYPKTVALGFLWLQRMKFKDRKTWVLERVILLHGVMRKKEKTERCCSRRVLWNGILMSPNAWELIKLQWMGEGKTHPPFPWVGAALIPGAQMPPIFHHVLKMAFWKGVLLYRKIDKGNQIHLSGIYSLLTWRNHRHFWLRHFSGSSKIVFQF